MITKNNHKNNIKKIFACGKFVFNILASILWFFKYYVHSIKVVFIKSKGIYDKL